jgi:tRNA uridine 5-carbamoylmethylation protein Kti12
MEKRMSDLIICQGLPGSGKTTWAKKWVAENPQRRARVNRDDLRQLMHGGYVDRSTELQVTFAQGAMIAQLLTASIDVVCDDTNLTIAATDMLHYRATSAGATWRLQSFLYVSIEECIRRDSLREGSARVGEKVIRDMWASYKMKGILR